MEKKCRSCGQIKALDEFYKQEKGMCGRTAECKKCRKDRSSFYAEHHKEEKSRSTKLLYDRKKELRLAQNKQWREDNPEYMREYRKRQKITVGG